MSYAVQSPAFLPQHAQEFGLSSWNIGSKIKNALFGRIGDWKNSILMVTSVFWIAKAALSFFSGSWTIALAEFFTGCYLSMIRKEYRDFTNLHKATGDYRKENIELKQSNLRFKQSNLKFEQNNKNLAREVQKISVEAKKIESENQKFAINNTTYRKHLDSMERTLSRAVGEINHAVDRGRDVSTKVLQDALKTLAMQRKVLEKMEKEVLKNSSSVMKKWEKVVERVESTNLESLKQLQEAKEDLSRVVGEVASLKDVRDDLRKEIKRLRGVRRSLEKSADRIQNASRNRV